MSTKLNPIVSIISWVLCIIAGFILVQTLFFKFTAAPESVYIFDKVGLGAPGRIGSGIVELIAAILLFVPRCTWLGAVLTLGVISGAIMSHLTVLGIVVRGDGGLLFGLAIITWVCAACLLFIHRRSIPFLAQVPIIGRILTN
jgi:hypothetical protein